MPLSVDTHIHTHTCWPHTDVRAVPGEHTFYVVIKETPSEAVT